MRLGVIFFVIFLQRLSYSVEFAVGTSRRNLMAPATLTRRKRALPALWRTRDTLGNVIIPYYIDNRFSARTRGFIERALRNIETNTCVRWRHANSQTPYCNISYRPALGCESQAIVGYPPTSTASFVHFGSESCLVYATVIHELLHVVGLAHEHSRLDSRRFISVYGGTDTDFGKYDTSFGLPYDYHSVMHYLPHRGPFFIRTNDPQYHDIIGRATDASAGDYLKVCRLYGCTMCMNQPTKSIRLT